MAQHCIPDPFKHGVSQGRDGRKDDEQDNVETVDDNREPIYPSSIVWQIEQQYRDYARAHSDGEPSGGLC